MDGNEVHPETASLDAPGAPGASPTWAPAAKSAVGCALSARSMLWFTLGRGIVTEVYHPWLDHAAIRDLGFFVTAPDGFVSEETSDCVTDARTVATGIPAYQIRNRCNLGIYEISKQIIADPDRSVLLQRVTFKPLRGKLEDYRLFVLSSPRLGNQGQDNSGWTGSFNGQEMLFARHESHCLALAHSSHWLKRSVGYVGVSDSRQDLKRHGGMTRQYPRAARGHICLAGEIDLTKCNGEFVLALAFDRSPEAAALNARLSLAGCFEQVHAEYVREWSDWQKQIAPLDEGKWSNLVSANGVQRNRPDSSRPSVLNGAPPQDVNLYRTSMMVLGVHRSKQFGGASVASLSVPWGEARGKDDRGGYHLVWPRDLVEESFGFLAAGAFDEALCAVKYFQSTQKLNGGWSQDMWLEGTPYSDGVQLDESALPILLVDLAHRVKAISEEQVRSFWPMIRAAAAYLIRKGPATGEDRWENTPGLSPYTLATEIAALLVAARFGDEAGEKGLANYFRQTADLWNSLIEEWTYVTGTKLARKVGVDGYYIRIAPAPGMKSIRENGEQPAEKQAHNLPTAEVVSPDALAMVRFGLRAASDARIVNTVKVIDVVNRVETPAGPCWRRYNGDYYGESNDGQPFTGKKEIGHGRAWPLLIGERGHLAIAAGNLDEAERMLSTMGGLCSQTGLLPEQVWDSPDIPRQHLFFGRPSGSAMPLAWTHSEYVRLLRSLRDKKVFDLPIDSHKRYVRQKTKSDLALWRFDHQPASFMAGKNLRIELMAPGVVHFTTDSWLTCREIATTNACIGIYFADLPTSAMKAGDTLRFTFRWPQASDRWEGRNFTMLVDSE